MTQTNPGRDDSRPMTESEILDHAAEHLEQVVRTLGSEFTMDEAMRAFEASYVPPDSSL